MISTYWRQFFVRRITIPGTEVIPVPLFEVLDGKHSNDYVARVEPSSQGGRKMAGFLLDIMDGRRHGSWGGSGYYGSFAGASSQGLEAQYMAER